MATLLGPLMSLGAKGTIAKTITFSKWKGIPTARQKSDPTNPNTAAQAAQRSIFSEVVSFWRTAITGASAKTGWNLAASIGSKAQSGFNAFTSAATKIAAQDDDASMSSEGMELLTDGSLTVAMKNIDDGATGDETGTFTIKYGSSVSQMTNTTTGTITTGELSATLPAYAEGTIVYAQIVKDAGTFAGAPRSGVEKLTVEAT